MARGRPVPGAVDGRPCLTLERVVAGERSRFIGMAWSGRLLVYVDGRTGGEVAGETLASFARSFRTLDFED
jgi:hypothetical protein